jgi:hypothetical protein
MGTPERFGVFDSHRDGTLTFRYASQDWKA